MLGAGLGGVATVVVEGTDWHPAPRVSNRPIPIQETFFESPNPIPEPEMLDSKLLDHETFVHKTLHRCVIMNGC